MKTIGMIGGLSWHSTVEYYRIINETVGARLGDAHSAQCVLFSVEYGVVDALEREGRIADTASIIVEAARRVERAGAEVVIICSNTTHMMADQVQAAIRVPLLHIADATGRAIRGAGLQRVGLLGTRYTMEGDFIRGRLERDYGLEVLIPEPHDRDFISAVIYDELCVGNFLDASRERYNAVIGQLLDAGAEGIILGCTEIGLLVRPEDFSVPLFDTLRIHAVAAADYALTD